MKGFLYIILFGTFILLYYKSPMYCLVLVGIIIVLFLYTRYRRSTNNGSSPRGSFFRKGNIYQNNNQVNDLATLFMIQQMFNDSEDLNGFEQSESNVVLPVPDSPYRFIIENSLSLLAKTEVKSL